MENHTQCNYDFLQIFDGPSASYPKIGKFCGMALPKGGTINSTTHEMFLSFHSDASVAHDGFTLIWRSALPGLFNSFLLI
jgi:cubilin